MNDFNNAVEAAIPQAYHWLNTAGHNDSTEQLAHLVRDHDGITFTMNFVDKVARPEDNHVAAKELRRLPKLPNFIGPIDKTLIKLGALTAPIAPHLVMPLARARMRQMVGHLVLDANSKALQKRLTQAAEEGYQLNLNLLGEAVLGDKEATSRLQRTRQLLQNPQVTYVSIKASSVVAQLNPWDIEGNCTRLKERLRPLYRDAQNRDKPAFINLDMEEYKDLSLTIKLFTELLDEKEFHNLEAGIVLQAYLPDTYEALQKLAKYAAQRRAKGGAPIKIRLVKGANLSMERVDAEIHNWPLATYNNKTDVDANFYRLLDYILTPEHANNIRIGVASHNLFTIALAHQLATQRGVTHQLDIEMLQGMAPAQAAAVQNTVGRVILYTPVVHAKDFDVAVSYLVRRLEENGEPQNFLHTMFSPNTPITTQEQAFREAAARRWDTPHGPNRTTKPNHSSKPEPDTDPALPQNREWAKTALAADPGPVHSPLIRKPEDVNAIVEKAHQLGTDWATRSAETRAQALEAAADALANHRGNLITVMTHVAGKTIAEADPEISEGIDFANYYAQSARQLHQHHATFTPHKVVLITPPWNFPMAIPVGGIFAALAAGAAVIIKPAPQVVRVAEIAVDAIRAALQHIGENPDLVQLINADEDTAGKALVSHQKIDAVILTGASETAALFRSWNPQLAIQAETSGKNAIIVTPAADPDLAVNDVYRSAFGHAGQKCSAASLVILVGSVGTSERFLNQLQDAIETLKVGYGHDISTTMNGLIEPPGEKLLRGLTTLEPGEKWLLKPQQLDDTGRLWSPGIRDNVQPGSWYHQNECFGPILGIMRADTLEQAIEWQNSTGYGLTGGLHSLDPDEIAYWREHVEVGNAYINRGITGAIVERQSFGGWKNSAIGGGAKAGGPNYVAQLGTWRDANLDNTPDISVEPHIAQLLRSWKTQVDEADYTWLWQAAQLDAAAWQQEFGREHDRTALTVESNVFRYRPLIQPLEIRIGANHQPRDVLRLKLAAAITGSPCRFSTTDEPLEVAPFSRIRTLGDVSPELYEQAAKVGAVVFDQPVLADGRRELLPWLLEQTITATRHRFGVISPELA